MTKDDQQKSNTGEQQQEYAWSTEALLVFSAKKMQTGMKTKNIDEWLKNSFKIAMKVFPYQCIDPKIDHGYIQ